MCVWYLSYRSDPFHCYLCCHVKPVSETSLSLEVQTKHCSTRATQTTAKLQTCMFMSGFLASILKQLCVLGFFIPMITEWKWVSRGKENSTEYIWQDFWLAGYKNDSNNSLSTCWGLHKLIVNRIYSKILHGKEEHSWWVNRNGDYHVFLQNVSATKAERILLRYF